MQFYTAFFFIFVEVNSKFDKSLLHTIIVLGECVESEEQL